MSVEQHRRGLLWRALGLKTVCDCLSGVADGIHTVARTFEWVSDSFHALEHDQASRYEALTGENLGEALNEPGRYRPEERRGVEIEAADEEDDS